MSTFYQTINTWIRAISLALVLGLGLAGVGCASGPQLVDHAFSFDAGVESPDVKILDFKYGTAGLLTTSATQADIKNETARQYSSINGSFQRGDTLYVKWRIKSTGEVIEDTVDLKSRLPSNISQHRIHFVIQGRELHVYLVSPELRHKGSPPFGPKKYRDYFKIYEIYPTSTLNK